MDDLVQSIGEIAQACSRLARQAEIQYTPEVADILRTRCRDPQRIEHPRIWGQGLISDYRLTEVF